MEQIDSREFDANHVENIIEEEDLNDINQRIGDETEWETELFEDQGVVKYPETGDCVFQFIGKKERSSKALQRRETV